MEEKYYIEHKEVMKLTSSSQSSAYKIIRQCNKELKEKGYMTIQGKTPRKYLLERLGLDSKI
ncbi:MAG: transcriptional regulator [Peptostreptococcus sp.]|uniref:DNA-binding protein n=1 Tax=Peptostreptococcus sp. TaxID=1262 RepID=UPI002FC8D3EC